MRLTLEEYIKGWKYYLGKGGRGYSYRWFLEEALIERFDKPINVLEFGGGMSTKHIQSYRNINHHVVIDSEKKWSDVWATKFKKAKVFYSSLMYDKASKLKKKYFDIILIDGNVWINRNLHDEKRIDCFVVATKLLKPNGIIIYHDAHRRSARLLKAINDEDFVLVRKHKVPPEYDTLTIETWKIKKKQKDLYMPSQ